MIFRGIAALIVLATASQAAETGADYIDAAPATIYESEEMSPQNMDFDSENNMFVAHSGWYNDQLVHYYKFRMYTPSTYPDVIVPGEATGADVPIQRVYIVTTTGDFDGAVGNPIIEHHTSDGTEYSDFMEVNFVRVPGDYVADTFKSEGDIEAASSDGSAETAVASGIILNLPVVPTGSTLQDPHKGGTEQAPIDPVPVWYKGVEVWTYIFEVTDQAAADYFAFTRPTITPDNNEDAFAFGITVKPNFASPEAVTAIPLWHMNQYSRGVTNGNGGGPSPAGMRNIINLDRPDDAYSPLWLIIWMTELPINYLADEASNVDDMTADNGFASVPTPMFVNCPDIGNLGDVRTTTGADVDFQTEIDASKESNWILGSDMSLIMRGGVPVSFQTTDGTEIASTETGMMGSYEYELMSSEIPQGVNEINVVADENIIRTLTVMPGTPDTGSDYIDAAPATIYESEEMSPQNMDFDSENNMFVAHSGWYNDQLVHYYKFRMYTPSTYPDVIVPGVATGADVPIQRVYIVTTTGDFDGAVGNPIIEHHTSDGTEYSDFMEINFVQVPEDYMADSFKSEGDIETAIGSGAADPAIASGIVLNIPVVPTGSTLQDPHKGGTEQAPIDPVPVWYKGVEVWTYIFEVTDQAAADYFAFTRPTITPDNDEDAFAFGITVKPNFASPEAVTAIPLWHMNQYSRGVTNGNGGGPNPAGMRNIINLDRPDDEYSPLWLIFWVTELPINYLADEVSDVDDMTANNGFTFVPTPMFVNCPDIGNLGDVRTTTGADVDFQTEIDATKESNWILGSHMSLIMKGGVPVSFQTANGTEIASTVTGMMGSYEYELMSSDVPQGLNEVVVVANEEIIRTLAVTSGTPSLEETTKEIVISEEDSSAALVGPFGSWSLAGSVLGTFIYVVIGLCH